MSLYQKIWAAVSVGDYVPPPPPRPTPVYIMAIIGNSIMAGYMGPPTIASKYFPPERVEEGCLAVNLAVAGNRIADQLLAWNNYVGDKSLFDSVYIQIGINDLLLSGETSTSFYTDALQGLIDAVNGDIRSDAKIIVAVMTPCRGYMDAALSPTDALAMYNLYKAVNAAYLSSTKRNVAENIPIDLYVTANRDDLMDGDGYLRADCDNGDEIHLNGTIGQATLIEGMQSQIDPYMATVVG